MSTKYSYYRRLGNRHTISRARFSLSTKRWIRRAYSGSSLIRRTPHSGFVPGHPPWPINRSLRPNLPFPFFCTPSTRSGGHGQFCNEENLTLFETGIRNHGERPVEFKLHPIRKRTFRHQVRPVSKFMASNLLFLLHDYDGPATKLCRHKH